jgi:hypothetical protein
MDNKDIFEFNREHIFNALRSNGIANVEVTYYGEGDCGDVDEIYFRGPNDSDHEHTNVAGTVVQKNVKSLWNEETKKWDQEIVETTSSIEDAISDMCFEVIDMSGHSGWENGNGGGGKLIFNVAKEELELAHYDTVVREEYSRYKF